PVTLCCLAVAARAENSRAALQPEATISTRGRRSKNRSPLLPALRPSATKIFRSSRVARTSCPRCAFQSYRAMLEVQTSRGQVIRPAHLHPYAQSIHLQPNRSVPCHLWLPKLASLVAAECRH